MSFKIMDFVFIMALGLMRKDECKTYEDITDREG